MSERVECVWSEDGWGGEADAGWSTSCGHNFEFNDGKPSDNGAKFCLYCGKPLVEVPYTEEPTDV